VTNSTNSVALPSIFLSLDVR